MDNQEMYSPNEKVYTNTRYMYINGAAVATGDNDFVMRVETNLPDGLGEDLQLLMSPRMAKLLRDVLNNAVEDYEELVGEIYMGTKVLDKHGDIQEDQSEDYNNE